MQFFHDGDSNAQGSLLLVQGGISGTKVAAGLVATEAAVAVVS
jgi:hypothetical protein